MAKRIRGLSRERLSHTVDLKKICRCKEAEDGEHECPAFDYLQEQAKPQIWNRPNETLVVPSPRAFRALARRLETYDLRVGVTFQATTSIDDGRCINKQSCTCLKCGWRRRVRLRAR